MRGETHRLLQGRWDWAEPPEPALELQAHARRKGGVVALQEARGKTAINVGVADAGIDIEVLVKGVVDQEGDLVVVTRAIASGLVADAVVDLAGSAVGSAAVTLAVDKAILGPVVVSTGKGPGSGLIFRARPRGPLHFVGCERIDTVGGGGQESRRWCCTHYRRLDRDPGS